MHKRMIFLYLKREKGIFQLSGEVKHGREVREGGDFFEQRDDPNEASISLTPHPLHFCGEDGISLAMATIRRRVQRR
jgi:hypothetical protein